MYVVACNPKSSLAYANFDFFKLLLAGDGSISIKGYRRKKAIWYIWYMSIKGVVEEIDREALNMFLLCGFSDLRQYSAAWLASIR